MAFGLGRGPFSGNEAANIADELEVPPSSIPAGFDAVLQVDNTLLQYHLRSNLERSGLSVLSARVPYQPASFPQSMNGEIIIRHPELNATQSQPLIEVRLLTPGLRELRLDTTTIDWTLEVNLITSIPQQIATSEGVGPPGQGARSFQTNSGSALFEVAQTAGPRAARSEGRSLLATGRAHTLAHPQLVARPSLLQAWLELEFLTDSLMPFDNDVLMKDFLNTDIADVMLKQAYTLLENSVGIRLTPRVALAGSMPAAQIANMGLGTMRVMVVPLLHPDGRDILSFCFNFGDDSQGDETLVRSFGGGKDFAYYVSMELLASILKKRWSADPSQLEFESDILVEMLREEGSNETGYGRARIRVTFARRLFSAAISASVDELGDPLTLASEQTIQLLRLWDPIDREIQDLGELGQPQVLPLLIDIQLFDKPPTGVSNEMNPLFRRFLTRLLLPAVRPLLEYTTLEHLTGYTTSALRAIIVRWDASLSAETPPDLGGTVSL
jgi:hypothetical protein